MQYLSHFSSPQLETLHRGKVRDSFRVDAKTRLIVVTDRISCFDKVLRTPIPNKGAVLNGIASYWFEATRHIVKNHFICALDPAISLVHEAKPIRVEMIVRGYLTGSVWRAYETGKRVFSGVKLPDGLRKNQKLAKAIVTPTTKEDSDREITPEEIVSTGLVGSAQYKQMEQVALALYQFGVTEMEKRKLLLVDTKYEFGFIDDEVALIDEIHTPDCSRFWYAASWSENPENPIQLDKEYVRQWLMDHKQGDDIRDSLPPEVIGEARKRYEQIYLEITGRSLALEPQAVSARVVQNLACAGVMKEAYVAVVMGSIADKAHADKLAEILKRYDVAVDFRVVSAHKNGERLLEVLQPYNESVESGCVIVVAGLSNGLGGAVAANTNLPVINCPPFRDGIDFVNNINSSLLMPSGVPAMTVVTPELAALAALRALNLPRLRGVFDEERLERKKRLEADDRAIRLLPQRQHLETKDF